MDIWRSDENFGLSVSNSVRERLVQLLQLRRIKARLPFQGILEVIKTIHYAASLDVKSYLTFGKPKYIRRYFPM